MRDADRRYRWGIFGLLGLVVALGIALSVVIARTGQQIHADATPLLHEKIPLLNHVSQLESALLRYQLTLNQYFAYSINRAHFLEAERANRQEIDAQFARLKEGFGASPVLDAIQGTYRNSVALGPRLDALMTAEQVDWDEARATLVELSIDIGEMRGRLDRLKHITEEIVYEAGNMTSAGVDRMSWLVYLYSFATLLTVLFVVHHIRARLRTERELAYQATHDLVTGLENRRAFGRCLQTLNGRRHMLILAAIDRYERVIGGLGHEAGDRLMAQIAARIRKAAERSGSRVFYLDGAGFGLLCPSMREAWRWARYCRMSRQKYVCRSNRTRTKCSPASAWGSPDIPTMAPSRSACCAMPMRPCRRRAGPAVAAALFIRLR